MAAFLAVRVATGAGETPDPAPPTCDGRPVAAHVDHVQGLAERLYRLRRWRERPEQPGPSIRREIECVLNADRIQDVLEVERQELVDERHYQLGIRPPGPGTLEAIASCESGGNPRAVGGGGTYRGKYQFDRNAWAEVGGVGDPAAAPEREQDRRAARLYRMRGSAPWPVCA